MKQKGFVVILSNGQILRFEEGFFFGALNTGYKHGCVFCHEDIFSEGISLMTSGTACKNSIQNRNYLDG